MFKEIFTESTDPVMAKIAQAIKGESLFDMEAPLKRAGFKTSFLGYSVLKVSKGSNTYMIASEKNAEPGANDIVQDGYVIGKK